MLLVFFSSVLPHEVSKDCITIHIISWYNRRLMKNANRRWTRARSLATTEGWNAIKASGEFLAEVVHSLHPISKTNVNSARIPFNRPLSLDEIVHPRNDRKIVKTQSNSWNPSCRAANGARKITASTQFQPLDYTEDDLQCQTFWRKQCKLFEVRREYTASP